MNSGEWILGERVVVRSIGSNRRTGNGVFAVRDPTRSGSTRHTSSGDIRVICTVGATHRKGSGIGGLHPPYK